ncbi:MAG: hypothetical protein B9J98_01685 [Candidatus Terraquivivens tikiterensis]|uniref:Uncharacterized protein n=1 Tax=Candidatus Terraquivivens tikiterensis TaxID=1980982 RepID=A0A2R7Y9Y4_9ARCH|nr:MAG: hypothetical protein B9J98_01685 [Candidatus Terraquivivens tikiterensis]
MNFFVKRYRARSILARWCWTVRLGRIGPEWLHQILRESPTPFSDGMNAAADVLQSAEGLCTRIPWLRPWSVKDLFRHAWETRWLLSSPQNIQKSLTAQPLTNSARRYVGKRGTKIRS